MKHQRYNKMGTRRGEELLQGHGSSAKTGEKAVKVETRDELLKTSASKTFVVDLAEDAQEKGAILIKGLCAVHIVNREHERPKGVGKQGRA